MESVSRPSMPACKHSPRYHLALTSEETLEKRYRKSVVKDRAGVSVWIFCK